MPIYEHKGYTVHVGENGYKIVEQSTGVEVVNCKIPNITEEWAKKQVEFVIQKLERVKGGAVNGN